MKPIYLIEYPKQKELTFDLVKDVREHIINNFVSFRVFHEDDFHFICASINRLFETYKINAKNYKEMVEADKISTTKYFIRVLKYGVNLKFVLILKLPNNTIHKIYY